MKKKLFGTDGIRTLASDEIFRKSSLNILSKVIIKNKKNFKIIIGRDTRESGKKIQEIFTNSLKNSGAKVYVAGLLPTPSICYLTKKFKYDLGIVISASHNPYQYNGIKFFNKNGEKLSTKSEIDIENNFFSFKNSYKKNNNGKIIIKKNSLSLYKNKILSEFKKVNFFNKFKVVIDCANGSTSKIIKNIFSTIKVKLILIKNKPNGRNINLNCGSLYPETLIKKVKQESADFGISFDGDGDRIICCDEKGNIIDGDKIIACLTEYFFNHSKKKISAVVGTLMSNMGLEKFIKKMGIKFYRANVGDKFVYNIMKKRNCFLGGEQSGHIILKDFSPSGDAILIALYLIKITFEYKKKISEIFSLYTPYIQKQKNIKLLDSNHLNNENLKKILNYYNNKNIQNNRVLVRISGTEPLIRILVEGYKPSVINILVKKIEKKIKLSFKKN